MRFRRFGLSVMAALAAFCAAAFAQVPQTLFTAADIEAASYQGGDLPAGRSALTARVQVLLDRAGISPGVVDGYRGLMSLSALMAFERRSGLHVDGVMDPIVWNLLQPFASAPVTASYIITPEDADGLVPEIPGDYARKALMQSQGFTSIAEKLGERFHMDEKFITFLNPGIALRPGAMISVTLPARPIKARIARILIDKQTRRVAAYDDTGRMVVNYPATIGSDDTPSPSGTHRVVTVALNPNYTYNPNRNFRQGQNDKPLMIAPGPNGPVGSVWIDLSKPTYGIHGTPTPSRLFHSQSHGCVRLTNWDAEELAHMVQPGLTTVEFLPGQGAPDLIAKRPVPRQIRAALPQPGMHSSHLPLPRPVRTMPPFAPAWSAQQHESASAAMEEHSAFK